MSMLCTLSQVKILLGIKAEDTTQDEKLTLLIKGVSAKIEAFIGYSLEYGTYEEELHSVNNRQLIQLNNCPIQNVSGVTINGDAIDDYKLLPEYSKWGGLYRGVGWSGNFYTRGFTHDIIAGAWDIKVNYTAGYYLPNDKHYTEGGNDSLPYDIVQACLDCVILSYNIDVMGARGLKAHSEGHISDTYSDEANNMGLSESAMNILFKYKRVGLA